MSEISDIEIGRLCEKVDAMEAALRKNTERLNSLEKQLERTKGIGIGVVLGIVGLSGATASILTKWLNG
jgi:hypothetical protein